MPGHSGPKALIGASIPRSGHHYLQRILSLYYGDEIFYCEWYAPAGCCKRVPCIRGAGRQVTYQKSHDLDFTLNQRLADALYLVQYRHPLPEALSDRELMKDGIDRPSLNYRRTRDAFAWWLAGKAIYYRKFHERWFENRVPNSVYVDYEKLLRETAETVTPIIRWVSGVVDEERLSRAIAEASARKGASVSARPFTPRVVENSPHFDHDLLSGFEAYVLNRCPRFGFEPRLSGGYRDHEIYGLILAQDTEEPLPADERDRLDAAARRAPKHPEIALLLAKRALKQGEPARAIALLEEAVARNPFCGQAYRLLAQACKTAGQPISASVTGSDALFACTKNPGALVEIAATMLRDDRVVNAIAALSVASVLQPENYRANYLMAKILAKEGRLSQARQYAERASEIKPKNKDNARLLAKIVKQQSAQNAAA